MPNRLKNIEVVQTEQGEKYRKNPIHIKPSLSEDDIYIITQPGDRYDILALEYYNDPELWWILASLDKNYKGTLNLKPGQQLRIPRNKDQIIKEYEDFNSTR